MVRSGSRRATNLGLAVLLGAVALGVWLLRSGSWLEGRATPATVAPRTVGPERAEDQDASVRPLPSPGSTEVGAAPIGAQDETAAAPAPVERTRQAGDWAIRGFVVDQDGNPVAQATVGLIRGSTKRERAVDERGAYSFAELAPGTYKLEVDPRSLPDGMLPPWRQHRSMPYSGTATGVFGTSVQLTGEAGVDADLRVFVGGLVKGRLLASEGFPIPGSIVAIRGANGIESGARTNAEGLFEIAGAYPGVYKTYVTLNDRIVLPSTQPPATVEFVLEPGAVHDLNDLVTRAR